ncbi:MAG: 16S rRNA (adenine(1518)-N(6)/adenine(1519)-N(6))-dimethyltransferase RsmA [Planctomycetota bacterium]|nr:16S rRNA (adenine(1518)-N(6)/adenine(1519)-N(6))-dimethyltransferase RsmA [Planctomycetota bacterium]
MSRAFPRTTTDLRAALEAVGVQPQRRHGQNFLTDVQAVDAIVRDADVRPGDTVVEVGTGPGLLTHALAETGARVTTFDIDPGIQRVARSLADWPASVVFETLDVLETKTVLAPRFAAAFEPSATGAVLLVSNLPYNAATPIVLGVLGLPHPPARLVVMIQEEVADKMLAPFGSRTYGAPSVAVGLKAQGRILRRFGPQVFWPRPRVRSAVLELVPHRPSPLEVAEHVPFGAFVTAVFTRRRKMLPAALRAAVAGLGAEAARAAMEAQGLDPTVRPEAVAPADFLALWRHLRRDDPAVR